MGFRGRKLGSGEIPREFQPEYRCLYMRFRNALEQDNMGRSYYWSPKKLHRRMAEAAKAASVRSLRSRPKTVPAWVYLPPILLAWFTTLQRAARKEREVLAKRGYNQKACNRHEKHKRHKGREWVANYFSCHPCIDCGEADPDVLDFDHRDPRQKLGGVTQMAKRGRIPAAELEAAKCDIRCANCHRRRHARERKVLTNAN